MQKVNNENKRTHSTEGNRQIFGGGAKQRNANQNQQASFHTGMSTTDGKSSQQRNIPFSAQSLSGTALEQDRSTATSAGEYQSILLTRYLKEPRLPPSSTYYNNQNSRSKKKSTVSRGSAQPLKQPLFNNQQAKTAGSTAYLEVMNSPGGNKALNPKTGVISYRNQNEIMRKIFGNEQNYHQVKSLLVKGPYQQPEERELLQKYTKQSPQQKSGKPLSSPMTTKPRGPQSSVFDRRNTGGINQQYINRPLAPDSMLGVQSPSVGPEEIILAKSQFQQQDFQTSEKTMPALLKTERHHTVQSAAIIPPSSGNNDQVEKAIFDLQDVKNNYFQEKSLFDHKIQQIQNKQIQNQTLSNGFGLTGMNTTAYNRTATNGFLPTANGLRPLTQGGLKNQPLMTDNDVLKGSLEQVTKEDLRERLVVAEMVMKKLFQRNKDMEDQVIAVNERLNSSNIESKHRSRSPSHDQSLLTDVNTVEIEPKCVTCKDCLTVRKDMANRENEMQERINELSNQLLKKTEALGKGSHLEYLQLRLEETMTEAKRHFQNYVSVRGMYNQFLESRLNSTNIQGGMKGQKIHQDILQMLKKNLEQSELALIQERDQLKLSYAKTQQLLGKKDLHLQKREKKLKLLSDEIERRKFVETRVQSYVKGLISKNQRYSSFLDKLRSTPSDMNRLIEDFVKDMERSNDHNHDEEEEISDNEQSKMEDNISVEVNDL